MRLTKSTLRRAAVITASTALVAGSFLTPSPAHAASIGSTDALVASLGTATAGSYFDSASGRMVVTVTDAVTAKAVERSGAIARKVEHSGAELARITAILDTKMSFPGTAYAVDPVANKVVVSVDQTVSAAHLRTIEVIVASLGSAATLERLDGALQTTISGGQAIYAGGSRCSLGFNVRSGSTYYFLTAGHCTNAGASWSASSGGSVIGTRTGSSFPGNDYGIVRYNSGGSSNAGNVSLYNGSFQEITSAGNATVGQSVRRSGSTTGVRSGSVTQLNATVTYSQGRVTGLIRTTVCAQPGDSGGSLFAGTTALGLTSGGSGNCSTGGVTYFQPVTEPLSVYGVSIY